MPSCGSFRSPEATQAAERDNLERLVPRNRAASSAVLGSVQRAAHAVPSRARPAYRRRLAVGGLAVLSLVLLTIYFRESAGGTLHGVEGAGAAVLRPFEVGAERIARPFTDAYGYARGLVHAKSDLAKARAEVRRWRTQAVLNASARSDVSRLQALLNFRDGPAFPSDYRAVNARVIARQPSAFEQEIVIAPGSGDGVRLHSPVVTDRGLVGEVTD